MNNIRLVYDVIDTKIDKSKTWYCCNNNTIYARINVGFNINYYLEANINSKNGKQPCIILSKDNINNQCRRCYTDNYGRLKIKPIAFRNYFKSIYNRDSNITFSIIEEEEEYIVVVI